MWIMDRMPSAKRLITALVTVALASLLQLKRVEAFRVDLNADSRPVQVRARTIAGTVTLDGKPIDGTVLSLQKFLGDYSLEPSHADAHVLGKAITAKDGSFRFDEMPSGKYVVFVRGASIEVELIKPKSGESDTVAIEKFADLCGGVSVTVISADGRKQKHRNTSPCN